jgi:hypothetical protein
MWPHVVFFLLWLAYVDVVSTATFEDGAHSLSKCPDTSSALYDYIVIGSGAGGGPVAARLAERGFSGASLLFSYFADVDDGC